MKEKRDVYVFKLSVLISYKEEAVTGLEKLHFVNYVPQTKCNLFPNNDLFERLHCQLRGSQC